MLTMLEIQFCVWILLLCFTTAFSIQNTTCTTKPVFCSASLVLSMQLALQKQCFVVQVAC